MLWEAVKLALSSIMRNKLRSVLTLLGIVIGVAAVIALVTLGSGASAKVRENLSKLGAEFYAEAQAAAQAAGAGGGAPESGGKRPEKKAEKKADVVDADFEVVDDDKKQ